MKRGNSTLNILKSSKESVFTYNLLLLVFGSGARERLMHLLNLFCMLEWPTQVLPHQPVLLSMHGTFFKLNCAEKNELVLMSFLACLLY